MSIVSSPVRGQFGEQLGQPRGERLAAGQAALLRLALEPLDHLGGRAGADVGEDQRLLEALPRLLVELALEQRRLDLGRQRLARLAHVLAQPPEEAAALLLAALRLGGLRDWTIGQEEFMPITSHGAAA